MDYYKNNDEFPRRTDPDQLGVVSTSAPWPENKNIDKSKEN